MKKKKKKRIEKYDFSFPNITLLVDTSPVSSSTMNLVPF